MSERTVLPGVWIGLGANLGDSQSTLKAALSALDALPATRLLRCSRLYRTAPVAAQGPDYLNAVAELSTGLAPLVLLEALQGIELAFGRERPYHNAPRTLDLDLLLWAGESISHPRLCVPHPRLHERACVLVPLAELAAELEIPGLGRVRDLLSSVAGQRIQSI